MLQRSLLILLLSLFTAGSASAFTVDGFTSGMPIASVQQQVARMGLQWSPGPAVGSRQSVLARGSNGISLRFTFCRGQLVLYGSPTGGVEGFMRILERETELRGPGQYGVLNEQNAGEWRYTLSIVWSTGSENYTLFMVHLTSPPETSYSQTWSIPCR